MWTIATLTTPAEELPLTETLQQFPACTFRVHQAAFESNGRSLSVWFCDVTADDLEAALAADPSVERFSRISVEGDEILYELVTSTEMIVPMEILHDHGATVEAAYGSEAQWTLEVRFPDRDALSAVADRFEGYGIAMNYHSIRDETVDSGTDPLTPNQREVLLTAIEEGYYEIPRGVTLEELAEKLGITHQALSESLRRAQEALVESQIKSTPTGETPE